MSPTSSRRFRFSLQALFVAITVAGLGAWWTGKYFAVRAEAAFQRTQAEHEAEMVTTDQLCQASRDLLHAELGVPLADHRAARERHAERISKIQVMVEAVKLLQSGSKDLTSARARWRQQQTDAER